MGRVAAIVVFLMACCAAFGIETAWQEGGVPVFCGTDLYWTGQSLRVDDNHILELWCDSHRGSRDVYAQMVDVEGNPQWDENLLVAGTDAIETDPVAAISSDGNIVIAWVEREMTPASDPLFLKKITPAGATLWETEQISTTGFLIDSVQLIADKTGGMYLVWQEQNGYYSLLAAHIDDTGHNTWTEGGVSLTGRTSFSTTNHRYAMHADSEGNMIVVYCPNDDAGVYARKYSIDGTIAWTTTLTRNFITPALYLVQTSDGIFHCMWMTGNALGCRSFNADGTFINDSLMTYITDNAYAIADVQASQDRVFVLLDNLDASGSLLCVENGQAAWPVVPFEATASGEVCSSPVMMPDGTGGCYVTTQRIIDDKPTLGVMYVTPEGDLAWITNIDGSNEARIGQPSLSLTPQGVLATFNHSQGIMRSIRIQSLTSWGIACCETGGRALIEQVCGGVYDIKTLRCNDNAAYLWATQLDSYVMELRLQILRPDGTALLPDNGFRFAQITDTFMDFFAATDNEGNIGVIYRAHDAEECRVFFQEFDSEGNPLGSTQTVCVLSSSEIYNFLSLYCSGVGDFVVTWVQPDNFTYPTRDAICQQRFMNGEATLGADGAVVFHSGSTSNRFYQASGPYLFWRNNNNVYYLTKFDGNGNLAADWPDPGLQMPISGGGAAFPVPPTLLSDGSIQFAVYWGSGYRIQRVTPDGNFVYPWEPLDTEDELDGLSLCSGNPIAMWSGDTYTVRNYDEDLNPVTEYPLSALNAVYYQYLSRFYPIGTDGWAGCVLLNSSQLTEQCTACTMSANLFNNEGELVDAGAIISHHTVNWFFAAITDQQGGLYIGWPDSRISTVEGEAINLYAQRLQLLSVTASDNVTPASQPTLSNYPNPFNPSTTIAYSLPTTGDTTLRIYNTRGQVVKTLVREPMDAGNHSVTWDGTDDSGNPVGSGVYLYRLQRGSLSSMNKCILMK
jgi:hypothetical protein